MLYFYSITVPQFVKRKTNISASSASLKVENYKTTTLISLPLSEERRFRHVGNIRNVHHRKIHRKETSPSLTPELLRISSTKMLLCSQSYKIKLILLVHYLRVCGTKGSETSEVDNAILEDNECCVLCIKCDACKLIFSCGVRS